MPMTRIVVRMPPEERDALDRLRTHYFDTTKCRISRAALVRVLVRMGLVATDVCTLLEVRPKAQAAERTGLQAQHVGAE